MSLFRQNEVKLTHLPTGESAVANEDRSMYKMRRWCFAMLRGKLWARVNGAGPSDELVRSYAPEDFNRTDIVRS